MKNWNEIKRWDGETCTGVLEWLDHPGRTYELHLDVDPKYHRQGIGRSMVAELELMAKEREGMSLYSFSAADNDLARKFFVGCGFREYPLCDFYGQGRHAWMYIKPIGEPK